MLKIFYVISNKTYSNKFLWNVKKPVTKFVNLQVSSLNNDSKESNKFIVNLWSVLINNNFVNIENTVNCLLTHKFEISLAYILNDNQLYI